MSKQFNVSKITTAQEIFGDAAQIAQNIAERCQEFFQYFIAIGIL